MPAKFMQPSQTGSGGDVPSVFNLYADADEVFPKGTPLRKESGTSDVEEHPLATTVIDVYGVSLEGVNTAVYDSPSGKVAIAKADRNTVFAAQCQASAAWATDLSSVLIGDQYGLLKVGTGMDAVFAVDLDDTTNVLVQIVKIDDYLDIVWFKFLESTLQEP